MSGPGRTYYLLALIPPVVGVTLFILVLFSGISGASDTLKRFVAPGEMEVDLRPGTHGVYYEHQSTVGDRVFSTGEAVPSLRIAVLDDEGGEIALRTPRVNTSYSIPGHAGKAVLEFDIARAGKYTVKAWAPEGAEEAEVVLAVGKGVTERVCVTVFAGFGLVFGSLALSLVLFIMVYRRRSRA